MITKVTGESLISEWRDTVGLTIDRIEEYQCDLFDEQIIYTMIFFTNGKVAIQEDQTGYGPTRSGLANQTNYIDILLNISKSKLI